MKKLTGFAFAAALATTGSVAFAEQDIHHTDQLGPVAMTESQMDDVAAGALITVVAVDVVDVNNNRILNNNNIALSVPVNAAVAAFGSDATAVQQGRPGRIRQQQ